MPFNTQVLVYGFAPFGNSSENVSEKVVTQIEKMNLPGVVTAVLRTRFNRVEWERLVEMFHPRIIIGLGQYPRGSKIRIETKAVNEYGSKRTQRILPITSTGPQFRSVSLAITPGRISEVTEDAGRFVCNFSMYVMLELGSEYGFQYGFLHIPRTFPVSQAVSFVQNVIEDVERKHLNQSSDKR